MPARLARRAAGGRGGSGVHHHPPGSPRSQADPRSAPPPPPPPPPPPACSPFPKPPMIFGETRRRSQRLHSQFPGPSRRAASLGTAPCRRAAAPGWHPAHAPQPPTACARLTLSAPSLASRTLRFTARAKRGRARFRSSVVDRRCDVPCRSEPPPLLTQPICLLRMRSLRSSSTTAQACARLALPVTTPLAQSSRPSSAARASRASWSAWAKRTRTSATRPSPSVVS